MNELISLARVFAYLSLQTIGGGLAAFPELQKLSVDTYLWLSAADLAHLYSIGQMSPGPNMMMIVCIGQLVAGFLGVVVVVVAFFAPTAILTFGIGRLWSRLHNWPWRNSIQRGLAPISIGLLLAGCLTLAKTIITGIGPLLIMALVFLILARFKINPTLLVLMGAVVGGWAL